MTTTEMFNQYAQLSSLLGIELEEALEYELDELVDEYMSR